jgi:hypothetical protein
MGKDFELTGNHPSVVINGHQYHYGKSGVGEGYLVENARYEKDYWYFKEEPDLRAFLVNLPESAERNRVSKAHPDWHDATAEQRDAYMADDLSQQRALAEEKIRDGTAATFNMDLEGKHGPYEPQRIPVPKSTESPLERIERQIDAIKAAHGMAGLTEAGKLRLLEGELDWTGVNDTHKRAVFSREIDFTQISPEQFHFVYADIDYERLDPVDQAVAAQLFADSHQRAQSGDKGGVSSRDDDLGALRPVTRGLVTALLLDAQPSPAAMVDYGIDSQRHYEALYYPVREGEITGPQLEAAYGDGQKLTALARNAPSNPHKDITFHTSWDVVLGRDRGTSGGGGGSGVSAERQPPSPSNIADQTEARSSVPEAPAQPSHDGPRNRRR